MPRAACLLATALQSWPGHAAAESPVPPPPDTNALETVLVSASPVMGTGIPLDDVAGNVQTLRAAQIDKQHAGTVTEAIGRSFSSVSRADTAGNPFQEDLVARGFTASPVLGTPQGIALYQNGVRINESFGDIVLWDFVPVFAVAQLQETPGSNPVFGLNALGGAVTLEMKNGFDFHGGTADFSGGSFGRYRATAQGGGSLGNTALYGGASVFHEDGWRRLSSSDVLQSFADAALRGDDFRLGVSLTLASNHLNGNGAAPAEDDPRAAFAVPDLQINHLTFLQGRGSKTLGAQASVHGTLYARDVGVEIQNGAASGFSQCGSTVCDDSGDPLGLLDGTAVPATASHDGILPVSTTRTLGLGGSLQLTLESPLAGRRNVANLGVSFDRGGSEFTSVSELGRLVFLNPPGTTTVSNGLLLGGANYNVRLDAVNRYYGLFFTDTLGVTAALSATLSGRFNRARIDLSDRFGAALTGDHSYRRFNPSAGLTYKVSPALTVYASYSEANRIPTAAELSCANPEAPCKFPLGFISDPDLGQVVARTVELGARGAPGQDGRERRAATGDGLRLDWFADVYETRNRNDILFVSSGPLIGSGYFTNPGDTRRTGAEAALEGSWGRLDFHANYGFVRATFASSLTMHSAFNPGADANGDIFVEPGDRLPEVPMHTGKLGLGYSLAPGVHLGVDATFLSSRYLRGDEANLQAPLPGYTVISARASWQATDRLAWYLEADNLLDRRYASFGLYGDPTGNGAFANFSSPRFYTPAAPRAAWIGLQLRL